ncbi:MAG: non-hydrolyzing UDP-N-acetylglucosamine 2-epimerase [Ardenticatenaceae bacterium]
MKILTVVGARPQFIKAAPVSKALRESGHQEFLVHTGQHYDYGMSQIFFEELGLPEPNVNLGVGSGSHGRQTGQMLIGLEEIVQAEKPDWILVYGDTNSTLAGALVACKLQIPIAHVEAGLRSFNRAMPEEHNRVLTDHCSELLFCPTQTAVDHLKQEGIIQGVHLVGDTMYDAVLQFSEIAHQRSTILQDLNLETKKYLLATVHRPYNTDVPENLLSILSAFQEIGQTIVFPVHPRTRKKIIQLEGRLDIQRFDNIKMIEPVGYLDMLMLEQHARMILTDSGGIQKEAYFFGVPCVTLRPETEWVETVEAGWNVIVHADREKILAAATDREWARTSPPAIFGNGEASHNIASLLLMHLTA